jgi:hypothetical protein
MMEWCGFILRGTTVSNGECSRAHASKAACCNRAVGRGVGKWRPLMTINYSDTSGTREPFRTFPHVAVAFERGDEEEDDDEEEEGRENEGEKMAFGQYYRWLSKRSANPQERGLSANGPARPSFGASWPCGAVYHTNFRGGPFPLLGRDPENTVNLAVVKGKTRPGPEKRVRNYAPRDASPSMIHRPSSRSLAYTSIFLFKKRPNRFFPTIAVTPPTRRPGTPWPVPLPDGSGQPRPGPCQ